MEETLAIKNLMEKNSKLKWTAVFETRKEKKFMSWFQKIWRLQIQLNNPLKTEFSYGRSYWISQ